MKGIYLAAYKAEHPGHDIKYQDINAEKNYLQVQLEDNSQMYFNIHTTKCILINGKCPFCEVKQ